VHAPSATRSIKILNWITEHELDQLKRRGWIERQREPRPDERRILLTLRHPRQTIGEGNDRPPDGGRNVPQFAARPAGSASAIRRAILTLV
jgi:hypothetical protein